MTMRIEGTPGPSDIGSIDEKDAPAKASPAGAPSFGDELAQAVQGTDGLLTKGAVEGDALAHGKGNLHEAALSLEEADISMRFLVKARNKVVDAYQERHDKDRRKKTLSTANVRS